MPSVAEARALSMSGAGCCTGKLSPQLQASAAVGKEAPMPTQTWGLEGWDGWMDERKMA